MPSPEDEIAHKTGVLLQKAGLRKIPAVDHISNLIIAAISIFPEPVAQALASLMGSYIPKAKDERLLDFVESLAQDVERVKGQIKADLIHQDQFAFVLEKTFRGVLDNYQKDKIDAYRAVFINALINKDSLCDEEQEIFLKILDNFTVRHLRILAVLNMRHRDRSDLFDVITEYNPGYDKESIIYVMEDLRNHGLVHPKGTVMSFEMNANYNQLTPMGKKFVSFISLET